MFPFADNPFAILTTIVAPAVLTNASSVLALGTGNRIARVVDRSRTVSEKIEQLGCESPDIGRWERQIEQLRARAKLLFWALRLAYASLGMFAAAALVAVVGSALSMLDQGLAFRVAAGAGLLAGAGGVGGLTAACALMVQEVRLALQQIDEEAAEALGTAPGD